MRGITYRCGDPVVINGENSEVYYGLISGIKKNSEVTVQWYVLFNAYKINYYNIYIIFMVWKVNNGGGT